MMGTLQPLAAYCIPHSRISIIPACWDGCLCLVYVVSPKQIPPLPRSAPHSQAEAGARGARVCFAPAGAQCGPHAVDAFPAEPEPLLGGRS